MPGRDGTGPLGLGPKSGGGGMFRAGSCNSGSGFGFGRGRGMGVWRPAPVQEDTESLRREAKRMEDALLEINTRLATMEETSAKDTT